MTPYLSHRNYHQVLITACVLHLVCYSAVRYYFRFTTSWKHETPNFVICKKLIENLFVIYCDDISNI